MRNCIICDICKKTISHERYYMRKNKLRLFRKRYDYYSDEFIIDEIDICPECYQELIETVIEKRGIKP